MSSDRNIDPATDAALDERVKRPVLLVDLEFASGAVYAWSGVGDLAWNGKTYKGVGHLGKIVEIEESEELQNNPLILSLSGVNPELWSISLNEEYRGRPARIWFGFLDVDHKLQGDPIGPFPGKMDVMEGELGRTGTLTLTLESPMADWETPRIRRYTHADQQAEFPDDFGLEFVSAVAEMELLWGVTA